MADTLDDVVELTDATAIRAIAHPARLVVLEALFDEGRELTATQAAQLAGTTPSAMSYHLRALERFGVVKHGTSTGDARERPWRRAARDLRIRPPGAAPSRAVALATSAVLSTAMDVTRQRLLTAIERVADPTAVRRPLDDVIGYVPSSVLVTAEEAKALVTSIGQLIEPYSFEHRTDVPDDAARMTIVLVAVPDAETPGDPAPTR